MSISEWSIFVKFYLLSLIFQLAAFLFVAFGGFLIQYEFIRLISTHEVVFGISFAHLNSFLSGKNYVFLFVINEMIFIR